jgi:hypothetical protein
MMPIDLNVALQIMVMVARAGVIVRVQLVVKVGILGVVRQFDQRKD